MDVHRAGILDGKERYRVLKFAIIGCGAIGDRHAMEAATAGKLAAVCDIIEERAVKLARVYKARAYTRLEDMLQHEKDLDVVAVCTPNGLHAAHSIQILKAGLHVLCEKPMALSAADCRQMIQEADEAGKNLFVIKQNRFNPPVAAVRQLLIDGSLGHVYSVQVNGCWNRGAGYYKDSWHGTVELDGGILFTQFSHFIDLLYWMIGDVKEAYAFGGNFAHGDSIAFDDAIAACLRFSNGAIASLHFTINSYETNMEGSMLIVAEKGTVKIGGQYLNTLEYIRSGTDSPMMLPAGRPANSYGDYQGSMSNHDRIYEHVREVLTKGAVNLFNGHEGFKTVEIIEKIHLAAK
jgi:predicted dehydrogenase